MPTTRTLLGVTHLRVVAPLRLGPILSSPLNPSYRARLSALLKTLTLLRQQQVEVRPHPHPLPDVVRQHESIHSFAVALLPAGGAGGRDQVVLDVVFDGGLEPYLRIIWGPLGRFLDLIFCHCEGYPGSQPQPFQPFLQWVRQHAVPTDLLYVDSGATIADAMLNERLAQRLARAKDADALASTLSRTVARGRNGVDFDLAAPVSLGILKAMHELAPYFHAAPPESRVTDEGPRDEGHRDAAQVSPAADDAALLRRATADFLPDLRRWLLEGRIDASQVPSEFRAAVAWFAQPLPVSPAPAAGPALDLAEVQQGVLVGGMRRGVLALMRIHPQRLTQVRQWLAVALRPLPDAPDCVATVALTVGGVRRLGLDTAGLPAEFVEGMEARASLLGDLHANHPQAWRRPRDRFRDPVELGSVDLVLLLRAPWTDVDAPKRLKQTLRAWVTEDAGLHCVSRKLLYSRERDHLGFVDGVSQPQLEALPGGGSAQDRVPPGEIFLGYPNTRDVDVPGQGHALLHGASFMVLRKLRIHRDRFEAIVERAARAHRLDPQDVRERMIGRRADGRALVAQGAAEAPDAAPSNDFGYNTDAAGTGCPLGSHVRRCNPRAAVASLPVPRILRRGMSYGATDEGDAQRLRRERGLMFIAFNASLAEQFEVIQRWIAGGNATGLASGDSDPLLGVPVPGRPRLFKCFIEARPVQVDLGDLPLVSLDWGLYALVLAPPVLASLAAQSTSGTVAAPPAGVARPAPLPTREALEDVEIMAQAWQGLEHPPQHAEVAAAADRVELAGYARVLAGVEPIQAVLRDAQRQYSMSGQRQRMHECLGADFHLGQDPGRDQVAYARAVNDTVAGHRDAAGAFAEAWWVARAQWDACLRPPGSLDLRDWMAFSVGHLCRRWFGLPSASSGLDIGRGDDSLDPRPATCPGDFLHLSRYLFTSPAPMPGLQPVARLRGQQIQSACLRWLDLHLARDERAEAAEPAEGALSRRMVALLQAHGVRDRREIAATLAGLLIGMAPTLAASGTSILARLKATRGLWDLRLSWPYRLGTAHGPGTHQEDLKAHYPLARHVIEPLVWEAMRQRPVPHLLWRTRVKDQQPVVLGIGVAAQVQPHLLFGASAARAADDSAHGCPAQTLAIAQLSGFLAAVAERRGLVPGVGAYDLGVVR